MAHNLNALKAAVKLLADAGEDSIKLVQAGQGQGSVLRAVLSFQNLLPDLMDLVPQIGDLPAEASALNAEDTLELASYLVAELGIPEGHVSKLVDATLALLNHIVKDLLPVFSKVLPAVEHLIEVLRGKAQA